LPGTLIRVLLSALACLVLLPAAALAAGGLTPDKTSLDFGNQDIHTGPSPQQTVMFTNNSGIDLNVSSITITGTDQADFSQNNNCGNFVANGNSCNVNVQFDPSTVGPKTASLDVTDDLGTNSIPLSGVGATGTLSGSPPSFNQQPYFFGSQQQNANLNNNSAFAVTPGQVTITGPDAGFFSIGFNGCNFTMNPGNGCSIGVSFNPTGPGTKNAQLEIANDGTSSPLILPLTATALSGPHAVITPPAHSFGDVAVGSSSDPQVFTVANDGDFPLQIQQLLILGGTPQLFPVSNDTCSGQNVNPGSSCQLTVRFAPDKAGERQATIFIVNNSLGPIPSVPLDGTGVDSPNGSASISGTPEVGATLTCQPHDLPAFTYQWLLNGQPIAGAAKATYSPVTADIGGRLSCRVHATNSVGSKTVVSPQTGAVVAADLSRLSGSLVATPDCRSVQVVPRLRVGGAKIRIAAPNPVTPWALMAVRGPGKLVLTLDGHDLGSGQSTVSVNPRRLAQFGDGEHTLRVSAGARSIDTPLGLSPCALAARLDGGPHRRASLVVSARNAIADATVTLPRTLRVNRPPLVLGKARVKSAGNPAQTFSLIGPRTSSNGTKVALERHSIRISSLPSGTGVVRLSFRSNVIVGSGGSIKAEASFRGMGPQDRPPRSSSPAIWHP